MTTARPSINPPVLDLMAALRDSLDTVRLCSLGYHAWVPWLPIFYPESTTIRSYMTWCCRSGCKESAGWDL